MNNPYRGPSIDAAYQVSVHLTKQFQRRGFFRKHTIINMNCLWWPCLLMDRDKMSNLYREPSIDASYQVSVHMAEEFQRRRLKCEKLTDDRCQVMAKVYLAKARWAKNAKTPHCHNSSQIQSKNRRNKQNWYVLHTFTWPLTFLAWYKKKCQD